MRVIAIGVDRIGKQTLYTDDATGECFVSIENRTYRSAQPVEAERVGRWIAYLRRSRFYESHGGYEHANGQDATQDQESNEAGNGNV